MESIIHAKWVTGWVSYFHATRHKVLQYLCLKVQLSTGVFVFFGVIALIRDTVFGPIIGKILWCNAVCDLLSPSGYNCT